MKDKVEITPEEFTKVISRGMMNKHIQSMIKKIPMLILLLATFGAMLTKTLFGDEEEEETDNG